MRTLREHLSDSQLTANIVRSELNHGRSVFLVKINGTNRTMVTSQPSIWGGKRVKNGIGAIALEGEADWRSTYSSPIDEINEFDKIN